MANLIKQKPRINSTEVGARTKVYHCSDMCNTMDRFFGMDVQHVSLYFKGCLQPHIDEAICRHEKLILSCEQKSSAKSEIGWTKYIQPIIIER